MTKEEFFEWLDTCPAKFVLSDSEDGTDYVTVTFLHVEDEENEH